MIGLPRSLRGRTLLLTVIGIMACEFVTFAVFGFYRHTLLAGRARDFVSGQIEMVRAALTHATPEQVSRELERPFRGRRLTRTPDTRDGEGEDRGPPPDQTDPAAPPREPPADSLGAGERYGQSMGPRPMQRMHLAQNPPDNATAEPPEDIALPQVVVALRDEYGANALRFTPEPDPAVWVRLSPGGWWLMFPFARYSSPPIPWSILVATLVAVALMGGLVGLYSFHLSRPLRALADAAAQYRVGKHPGLPLTGPDEIQAVTVQFNAMAERLERDDAERRVMLAGLPHDLRAPLARARLRLELMDDGPDSPKEGLARDLAEVGRIADQFVAYLRGLDHDTGSFRDVALHEIVRDRALVWRESGHDITIDQVDAMQRQADPDALMRAIDNLVGNAFAHGSAPVDIAGRVERGDEGNRYRITVRDHGPGIPSGRRAEALKPFTRLDEARGVSGHCGLGLAVVQAVASLHDGFIELGDAPGGGLAATIVLPA